MPTKTKAKIRSWGDSGYKLVEVSKADLKKLYETVNINSASEPERAEKFNDAIQKLINRRSFRILGRMQEPLPAHVLAALKPIEAHATALLTLLDSNNLPLAVLHALDTPELDDGSARHILARLSLASQAAINVLSAKPGSGQQMQRYAYEMQYAKELLNGFFEAEYTPPDSPADPALLQECEADRTEFIKICSKYLPKAPSKKMR